MTTEFSMNQSLSDSSNSLPIRDKIIVCFSNHVHDQAEVISDLFGISFKDDQHIYHDLEWTTKYYSVRIDLYIDSFDSLRDWVQQFCNSECDELRDVLAGLVLVVPCKVKDADLETFTQLADCMADAESFFVVLKARSNPSEECTDSSENKLLANGVEIVCRGDSGRNEYGEVIGTNRVREIIDTYDWQTQLLKLRQPSATKELEDTSSGLPLNEIMTRLQEARTKYLAMDSSEEREIFARDVAHELSEQF